MRFSARERGMRVALKGLNAVARFRQGQVIGGMEGKDLTDVAGAWMTGQTIRNPARVAAMRAPGISE